MKKEIDDNTLLRIIVGCVAYIVLFPIIANSLEIHSGFLWFIWVVLFIIGIIFSPRRRGF